MKTCARLLVWSIAVGGALPAALGSFITPEIDATSLFRDGRVCATISIHNAGDQSAESIHTEVRLRDVRVAAPAADTLGTNEVLHASVDLGPAPVPAGTDTIVFKVRYLDPNGYPFSAIHSIPLVTADPDPIDDPIGLTVRSIRLWRRSDLAVEIRPSSSWVPTNLPVQLTLVLPDELDCATPRQSLEIRSGGTVPVRFRIRNGTARPTSTYRVLVVADFQWNGQHRSVSVPAAVEIYRPKLPAWSIWFFIGPCVILFLIRNVRARIRKTDDERHNALLFDFAVLAILTLFALLNISPPSLILNTTPTGGDTPAHNYLVSHLRETLLANGQITSWASGWWCGFPMFQYYFCLPYLLMALLSAVIPLNIAFKVVSVLGILGLPAAAYGAGRLARLPRPVPILLAVAALPLLFDASHTMWGVNILSTFAGMISNSLSFPIMLLFLGSACRDVDDGRFRLRTSFLLAAVVASHFFTSVMALAGAALIPFVRRPAGYGRAFAIVAAECGLGLLLMAWWIVPLLAKQDYAMDFGINWELARITDSLRPALIWALVPAVMTIPLARFARTRLGFMWVLHGMLLLSAGLLLFGYRLSPVFVNVRLQPFVLFALLALAACGIGLALRHARSHSLVVAAMAAAVLTWATPSTTITTWWAEWNYQGMELKSQWPVVKNLVLPLRGTPGRLANDLHERNNMLGSTRVFEAVPSLIGKPVLEGGIVNSAVGSMFSYYIQGETSDTCAGYPTIMTPTSFNIERATKHLELFNVKHFIARSERTRAALDADPRWKCLRRHGPWSLYELTSHDGRYVYVPAIAPRGVRLPPGRWKHAALKWIYEFSAVHHPFALLPDSDPDTRFAAALTEPALDAVLSDLASNTVARASFRNPGPNPVTEEQVTDTSIRFRTRAIGQPHIVKMMYYPNWQVRGADRIYMVTPCFMLVYPTSEEVELYYAPLPVDHAGRAVSMAACFASVVVFLGRLRWRRRRVTA